VSQKPRAVQPPVTEQRRIAEILDAAAEIRCKRLVALERTNALIQSVFVEMFGVDERSGGASARDRLDAHLSFITSGGRGWAKFYASSGRRFLRSFDVQMNGIGEDDVVYVNPPNNAEARRTEVAASDVLLTITGSRIGRVAAVPPQLAGSYISQHVAILRPKPSIVPRFLAFYMSLEYGGQVQIAKAQYGQTKPGLNFDQIRDFKIPVPPIHLQRQFVERAEEVERLAQYHNRHLSKLDALFVSLQHHAFNGELTSKHAERELEMVG
jgi:type I restriction enzyme S subunit